MSFIKVSIQEKLQNPSKVVIGVIHSMKEDTASGFPIFEVSISIEMTSIRNQQKVPNPPSR